MEIGTEGDRVSAVDSLRSTKARLGNLLLLQTEAKPCDAIADSIYVLDLVQSA